MSGQMVKNEPLETFGKWQTELYIPPPAKERGLTLHIVRKRFVWQKKALSLCPFTREKGTNC
jgi:hypothetical protein